MKAIIRIFAVIGIVALCFAILKSLMPNYQDMGRKEFAHPDALSAIETLYLRVEADNGASLKDVKDHVDGSLRVKRIPLKWIPEVFYRWGVPEELGTEIIDARDVLAYYSESKELQGIEFSGTRYGCFASRSPMMAPPSFESAHRVATKPLHVTIWTVEGD